MPELPEVETTRAGIEPQVAGQRIKQVIIRDHRLRWPVSDGLASVLPEQTIRSVSRRAKYLLFTTTRGTICWHLGMSGRLKVIPATTPLARHDHIDVVLASGQALRFNDSRRFGSVFYFEHAAEDFWLLAHLGPEPLDDTLSGDYLYQRSCNRKLAVKNFIMDQKVVVGVGNIYANEALFMAGIHPKRPAHKISRQRYHKLAAAIKQVLAQAIRAGGTTLRDYRNAHDDSGWFQLELSVYDQAGTPCPRDGHIIERIVLGQRSTYFCPHCQT